MDKKLKDILIEPKSFSNKDLEYGLKTLSEDFEKTKELLIKLTKHLDGLELNYNKVLKEYNSRK